MYPLVLIYMVGIIFKDKKLSYYVMPFGFIGLGISLYQMLLQSGLLSEAESCRFGVSCLDTSFKLLGVFTIPMQSFIAFLLITLSTFGAVLLDKAKKESKNL
jgi:disulfide bond formation protein DsbB